jgi:1-acyl-sn-glycerol-3-phosphate acyltransferase
MRLLHSAVSWVTTVPFLAAFALLLVLFDPLQRLARLFGRRPQELVLGALQIALVSSLRLAGTRFAVERSARVEPRQPYLVLSNHQSMFDIPLLIVQLFWSFPKFVSKRELARGLPSVSYNLRVGGNALIDRNDREQALGEIRALGRRARERRVSAVIFPEGTRARDGRLGPFKLAGAQELLEAAPDLPVLPVAIDGSWKLLRHGLRPVPFGTRVRLALGDPLPREPGQSPGQLIERAEAVIRATLERWRAADPRPEAA